MTLNCYKFKFSWNFADLERGPPMAKGKCPYCQQQNCNPLNVLFSDVYITIMLLGVPLLGVYIHNIVGKNTNL